MDHKKAKYENADVKCLESFIQFFKHLNRNRCNVNFWLQIVLILTL